MKLANPANPVNQRLVIATHDKDPYLDGLIVQIKEYRGDPCKRLAEFDPIGASGIYLVIDECGNEWSVFGCELMIELTEGENK